MMWGYGMGAAGWVFMVLIWVLVAAGIVWLVRAVTDRDTSGDGRRILDERFARGELDQEEYETRRRTLR